MTTRSCLLDFTLASHGLDSPCNSGQQQANAVMIADLFLHHNSKKLLA